MAICYITENDLLVSYGYVPDGMEEIQATGNQKVTIGELPEEALVTPPYTGARWNIKLGNWTDTRQPKDIEQAKLDEVISNRYNQYPDLAVFADAFYWFNRGDSSKMDAWLAACDQVKKDNPK